MQQCNVFYIYIYILDYELSGEKFNKVMLFPHLQDFFGNNFGIIQKIVLE